MYLDAVFAAPEVSDTTERAERRNKTTAAVMPRRETRREVIIMVEDRNEKICAESREHKRRGWRADLKNIGVRK
jgi:hypothetical protein